MISFGYRLILLFPDTGNLALPGGPFRINVPHQACLYPPLPEVHPSGDPHPDLPGSADAQCLRENNVGEDKGYLGVPTHTKYPPPFRYQDGREAAPY